MPAFYRATIDNFLRISEDQMVGLLSLAYARQGFEEQKAEQTLAWARDLRALRSTLDTLSSQLPESNTWSVLLEFEIPRKMKRVDVILLAGSRIVVLELKTHAGTMQDCLQAEEYALLLHYFHQPSDRRHLSPLVISPVSGSDKSSRQEELPYIETAAYWISPVARVGWAELAHHLISMPREGEPINAEAWEAGSYRPVPTIIQAALALREGLGIREIAHSGAAQHEVGELTGLVQSLVEDAKAEGRHLICFVTGVPGSGKTLVGLNLAFHRRSGAEPIHFMSGNGPLVKVLQSVLTRHRMSQGVRALDAKIHAKTLIENVHVFARTYTDSDRLRAPSNHVVIFDEAQRAWNRTQNKAKFNRDYSEPEMLLKIMERHADWAVVIALVGGGQEINNGEAGLAEWGRSLSHAAKQWEVWASPEALAGGTAVAGSPLTIQESKLEVCEEKGLHLQVSIRSLRAATYAAWVNAVVEGNQVEALRLRGELAFPIFLMRDLEATRSLLRRNCLGLSRAGLVGSSQATRLRAEGLEPDSAFHGGYPWEHWYLAGTEDVRSSFQMEVFATEFEIQGLELDWVGLCWGGDFVWSPSRGEWLIRAFRAGNSKWSEVKSSERRVYRRNAYRVLLTRARQGIVIYVPRGDAIDPTRRPDEFEATARFLQDCGAKALGHGGLLDEVPEQGYGNLFT